MSKKATLTIEEFRKLPRAEQNVRERDLSDHDRFLARMGDWQPTPPILDELHIQELVTQCDKETEEVVLLRLFNLGTNGINQKDASKSP